VAKPPCVVFLFDWRPVFWSTREEYFRQLAERLTSRGITPVLIASELDDPEVLKRFTAAGTRVEICSYHAGLLGYWRQIRRLRQEFSVKLAHIRFFDYFAAVAWICRLSGIRNIFFTEANSGDWTTVAWKQTLLRLRTAVMCWPLTHCIAISGFIQKRLESVGIASDRITVIYNGVDIASFKPDPAARQSIRQQMGAQENTVVLIFAAVFLEWKRPQMAIQACAELVRQGLDVQLWMAGKGPLKEELEREVARLQIEPNVKWIGYQKDPQRWMAAADLFLHTAVGEAFGNVFIEAMACGLPAIATNSGAAPEIVSDRENGRLVDAGGREEAAELAEAIAEVMRDPARYSSMSAAAQKNAGRFSTQICVDKTMNFYAPWL
jgi:glycosyltransferase involved in cell wall biosynthesis